MAFKFIVFAVCLAAANAGYVPSAYAGGIATPAISSVSSNTLRSFGNVGQVSTYSKTLDTPFSSVRKSDIRVTNDAQVYAPAAYAAPAYAHQAYAAPAYAHQAYAAPAYATTYAAPAIAKVAAPVAYAAPAYAHQAYAAPVAHHPAALGVAYSAAPAVAHISYDGAYAHYAY